MKITTNSKGTVLEVALEGRVDIASAPMLADTVLARELSDLTELSMDIAEVQYISSAGLKALYAIQKKLAPEVRLRLLHANELVREVLEITGFNAVFDVA